MVVVGTDVHKRTRTFVAVDEVGRKLAENVVPATTAGHHDAAVWVRTRFGCDVRWGIEDSRHLSARLERDLPTSGQQVVRVPPKLVAQTRACARTRGKSDPIDASAVARAVMREPDLTVASHDEVSRKLKLLVDRREDPVGQRSSAINRLLWRGHDLDPAHARRADSLDRAKPRRSLGAWLATQSGRVAELARDVLAEINRLTEQINTLAARICDRVSLAAPALLSMPGCGELTAARLSARPLGGGTNSGLVGQHSLAGTHYPLRQLPTQRRAGPHRGHPDPSLWARADLLSTPPRRRRLRHRSPALPQTTPGPRRNRTFAHRPPQPSTRSPKQ